LRRERFLDKKIKQKHTQKAERVGKATTDDGHETLSVFVPGQKIKKAFKTSLFSLSLCLSLCLLSLSLSLVSLEDSLGDSPLRVFVVRFFPQRERENRGLLFTGKEGSSSLARESLSSRERRKKRE
jgi:hypothetical protein